MKRVLAIHLLLLLVAHTGTAQGTAQAEKLLASAQRKATIDGDLRGAIEDYKSAVAAAGGNRALAAQALLRMAECHQKLGELEAQAIYERVVRDYADQKDVAVIARSRLGPVNAAVPVKGDRSVWTGRDADGFGTVSPDGRYLTFTDWSGGAALMMRDLATGTNHRLATGGGTQFSAISKDGRFVAYQWREAATPASVRGYTLRVARLRAAAISESRQLINNDEVQDAAPYDWSPDGKWIAVGIRRRDGTNQIALASVQDGSLRPLKSLDWKEPTKIFFSPDGRFVAYDLPPGDTTAETHVFVLAVDGSREVAAVAHPSENTILGWSPDGKHLLFSSNRTGTFGLWATPIDDGRPVGPSTLLKPDIASSWSLGLTGSGTMYVWKYASPLYVQASPVDLSSGKIVEGRPTFQRFITSRGRPEWSADGRHLAYQSCDPLGAGPCALWIHSMDTGASRELKVKLGYFFYLRWSPDGRELLTRGTDLRGRNNGLYRIDVETGEVRLVASPLPGDAAANWSVDGQHVHFRRGSAIVERNLVSGAERSVVQLVGGTPREAVVGPDGQRVAYTTTDAGATTLWQMEVAGGSPQPLLRGTSQERLLQLQWTSEGRALVIVREHGETRRRELWLVPMDGAAPRKLDIAVDNWLIEDGYRVDRSGKQVAFVGATGQAGLEIRALENFLPPLSPRPTAPK